MKVGIIGFGKIGQIRKQIFESLYPDTMFFIHDPNYNFLTIDEVYKNSEIIFVCCPNYLNATYTIKGLEKGKPIFCEKPPALNYDELLKVKEVYDKTKGILIYGFNHRQYDSVKKIKTIIDDPESGKLLWMRGRYGKAMGDPNTQGWRSDPKLSGGGILLDQGIHMLDLMSYFGGKFDTIQSIITNSIWGIKNIEDNVFLNLFNTKNNIAASLHSTMIEWRHIFSLEIVLENTYVALNGLKTPSGSYGKEKLTICEDKYRNNSTIYSTNIEFKHNNTWKNEIKLFHDAIINNSPKTNLDDALEVMWLIKEAYKSWK